MQYIRIQNIIPAFFSAITILCFCQIAQAQNKNSDKPQTTFAAHDNIKNILQHNSVFYTRIGWPYDPPLLDSKGKVRMMLSDDSPEKKFHSDFYKAGIKIHSSILFSGWIAPNKFDYAATDKALDDIFASLGPDALYIPRIKLNVPPQWCAENPEDTTVYYPAALTKEEIAELANTPAHDWYGIELPKGYTTDTKKRGLKDDRPNVRGLIGLQSFSSDKWLHDAGEALKRLIHHIENGKYGKNILAYHIAYGQWGETSFWRGWEKNDYRLGDYGFNNRRAFYDWGIAKYGSREALSKAWNQPDISRENTKLPTPMKRELHWKTHRDFFRADSDNISSIDYEKFFGQMNARAVEHFAKIVKSESGKAAGAFYGYYLYVPRAAYNGHLEFDKLLDSPYVDFLASPKGYRNVAPGDSGMEQTPPMSINLKKIFIDELDVRTHLSNWADAKNMDETRTMLWREFSKCMQSRSGFWWMDLHGGWFDSPEMLSEIRKIEDAAKDIRAQEAKSVSEVLIVSDNESFHYAKPSWALHRDLIVDTISRIRMSGAPVDHFRLSDLAQIDLSNYKAIVFINCTRITDSFWQKISPKFRRDATLVWHYAPAVWADTYDPSHAEKITGFRLSERETGMSETIVFADKNFAPATRDFTKNIPENLPEKPYPTFSADTSNGAQTLASYADGSAAFAKIKSNGHTNYFVSMPILKSACYRKIFEQAQVALPAPNNCAVYMDNRLCGIFPRNAVTFELSLQGEFIDMITKKSFKTGDKISLPQKSAIVLIPSK